MFQISADMSVNWSINWNSVGHRDEKGIIVAFTGLAN
jgi:hypothetical protein